MRFESNVVAYVTYRLLVIDGVGHQPYHQVASMGMEFEGGMAGKDGRMLGYLKGDPAMVDEVIKGMSAWSCVQLTSDEAMKWVDEVTPAGTTFSDPFVGKASVMTIQAASVGADGRINKPVMEAADVPIK